jgi:hypothetical protein
MSLPSPRTSGRDPRDPTIHELGPLRIDGQTVGVRLLVRRADDGAWRGRLRFDAADQVRETADIFCGVTEAELWQSVGAMGDHHLRDLYRSLG